MEYKLSDLFELQMGKTPDRKNLDYWNNGNNKWISIADLTKSGKYIFNTKETISNEAVIASGIKLIPKGTVIMSFKLTIGKTAITSEDLFSNEAIMAFIDKGIVDIEPSYLYYLLKNKRWDDNGNKAVMGVTLNKATLSQQKIEIPCLSVQNQVVQNLDKLNSLIENRNKQLELLDELVKSRFIEMFGMPVSNTKGWETQPIETVAPVVNYTGIFEDEVWLLNLDMVESQTGRVIDYLFVPKKEVGNSTCTFDTSNVLYSKLRPYLNKVVVPCKPGYATSELVPLQPIPSILNREYLAYMLRNKEFVAMINEKVAGAKMPRVSMTDFRKFPVPLPPLEIQFQFSDFVEKVDKSKFY